jgi:hypothetical protein
MPLFEHHASVSTPPAGAVEEVAGCDGVVLCEARW